MKEQYELWKLEERVKKGYRLHQNLLEKGEKPDTRPWGGIFENEEASVFDGSDRRRQSSPYARARLFPKGGFSSGKER